MVSITLAVTPEIKHEMDKHPDINWSAVARDAIQKRLQILKDFEEFTKDSTITEEDAIQLGRKVNKALAKRYAKVSKSN